MNVPVFDLHCDTAFELLGHNGIAKQTLKENDLHIDLQRAAMLTAYAQCFACYTTTADHSVDPTDLFQKELTILKSQINANGERIALAKTGAEIRKNRDKGLISAILTAEGAAGIGFRTEMLPGLKEEGFCMISLCWNEQNPLTGSHITGGGLTEQGRAFVKTAQDLGILIDVSHISDEGFWDIMDITTAPIVASHSNSRHIHIHTRNLSDEMFLAICKTGGAAGINLFTSFLGNNSLDAVCDHILHYLELDPDGTHIGLGGDLDGCNSLPDGFTGIQDYQKLAVCLRERGLPETVIENIFWNNALGVMERCCT